MLRVIQHAGGETPSRLSHEKMSQELSQLSVFSLLQPRRCCPLASIFPLRYRLPPGTNRTPRGIIIVAPSFSSEAPEARLFWWSYFL